MAKRSQPCGLPGPDQMPVPLSDHAYLRLADLVRTHFGIHLARDKQALIVNRLGRHVQELGLDSYEAFVDHVQADSSGMALAVLADLIVTGHTSFWREPAHFEFLANQVLPEIDGHLLDSGDNDLRFWCAAASTGEEPYSILMSVMEYFGPRYSRLDAGLLATDLSLRALRDAATGVYTAEQVERVPTVLRRRYFQQLDTGRSVVIPALRAEVVFRKFNLTVPCFPFRKPFHAIFCRNVMIYFDVPTRQRLAAALYACTMPGGYLFVGHSETVGPESGYRLVSPAVYRRDNGYHPLDQGDV